jgi:hypothetical protein
MLEKIHKEIYKFYKEKGEEPNAILLPVEMYYALKENTVKLLSSMYTETLIEDKIFNLDIIVVDYETDFKLIKQIKGR